MNASVNPVTCLALAALAGIPCSAAAAQRPLPPSPQLEKLDRLVGSWKGSGTAVPWIGRAEIGWTATCTFEPILGGHFLQQDMTVRFGDAGFTPRVFRAIWGFDRESERFFSCRMTDLGSTGRCAVSFANDDTLVVPASYERAGKSVLERTIFRLAHGGFQLTIERAVGADELFRHVTGAFVPMDDGAPPETDTALALAPAPKAMQRLARMVGSYAIAGEAVPLPGAKSVAISGREQVNSLFGDSVVGYRIRGDRHPVAGVRYEALGYFTWNSLRRCYDQLVFDNMGVVSQLECRWIDEDTLVGVGATSVFGKPAATRTVIRFVEQGMHLTEDRHRSDERSRRTFDARFTRTE